MLVAGVVFADWYRALPEGVTAEYVGRSSCVGCHAEEAALFEGSHHDLAMDVATDETVLGDFNDVEFSHHGITSRLYRDGTRFMVNTEGPDGQMHDYEVSYVFGYTPLQQYMIELEEPPDGASEECVGQVQVLRISWDTERKRWFYLEPPDVHEKIAPEDDLHWTGIAQRWNTMCAECHSTNLQRGYDPQTNKYCTTWSEIDVSCEACHGPGSIHVQLANKKSLFWDRRLGYGITNPMKVEDSRPQLETCAACHSRRQLLAKDVAPGHAYSDQYDLELLHADTYHADGQILDEVYVYGSFIQSRMYHKGIRCTDCHDPHSLQLKAPGNQVCTSCHQHPAGKYDTPAHHHHIPGSEAAECVNCHMPSTTYMAVDPRRDHSLRIPRPDLSVQLGTPNACTGCHIEAEKLPAEKREGLSEYADWLRKAREGDEEIAAELKRVDAWADAAAEEWYGATRRKEAHFATPLAAVRAGDRSAAGTLAELAVRSREVPAIARATALDELSRHGYALSVDAIKRALNDPDPMVRAAAVTSFRPRDAAQAARLLGPLLEDPARVVRVRAARALVEAVPGSGSPPSAHLGASSLRRLNEVLEEVHEGLMAVSDRAGAHLSWGLIEEARGNWREAIESYETAIRVEPRAVGARSNLAALLERLISAGHLTGPHAVQAERRVAQLRKEELPLLERDASFAPEFPELQFRIAKLQYLTGNPEDAVEPAQRAVELRPDDADYRLYYAMLLEHLGRLEEALEQTQELIARFPQRQDFVALRERIEQSMEKPSQ